jgi:hypothetical protein
MEENKMRLFYAILFICMSKMTFAATVNNQFYFHGMAAKKIYETLTGPAVTNDAAMGHFYRKGKNVLCRYVNADMPDKKGNNISREDARRYTCMIKFNNNGEAFPGDN